MDPWIKRKKAYDRLAENQNCWKAFGKTMKNSNFINRCNKLENLEDSEKLIKDIMNHYKRIVSAYGVSNTIRNKHKSYTILNQLEKSKFRRSEFVKSAINNLRLKVH